MRSLPRVAKVQEPESTLEYRVAALLRTGAALATVVVFIGGVFFLSRHWQQTPDYHVFRGEPRDLRSPAGIVREVLRPSGRAIIDLGLLLLILTPVSRVAFTLVAFLRARDRLYTAVTALVLAVLLYSLLGGLRWSTPQP